jgi:hypothetical protein
MKPPAEVWKIAGPWLILERDGLMVAAVHPAGERMWDWVCVAGPQPAAGTAHGLDRAITSALRVLGGGHP